ncbi:MAG: 2-dehydropantoate 2-reductase [Chloroflexi bacterium 13_1_40CM_67_9]|nr:MAG: 2-dehydropantoate 2-reductase [Chloroflexi bacterium 13_1_40CM_67_9]
MKLLIWGAGAIGGTIGAYLARAGHEVAFVDRAEEHVVAINGAGLRIEGPLAQFTRRAPAFTPDDLKGEFEHVVLAVKAQDTETATRSLAPHLSADGYVVSAQNGLNELTIKKLVGDARTIGCFVNFGADYLEPGVIQYAGRGAVVLGEIDGRVTARVGELHRTFLDFDDRAVVTTNIWGYLWGKLAYGAQLFATALTNDSIADALADPEYRDVYVEVAREVMRVARARQITPEGFDGFDPRAFAPDADRAIADRSLDEMVAFNRGSAKTHSGIWRDIAVRRRRTETDAQLGPIVTLGAEVGVATPLVSRLIALMHEVEDRRRPQSHQTLDLLKAALP